MANNLDGFIPEIWSARLLDVLEKTYVFAQAGIVNRDYEGEIRDQGDTVKINSVGPVTIQNYTKYTDMTAPAPLTGVQQWLVADQAKAWNFTIDDIDKAQMNVNILQTAMGRAGSALANTLDTFLAGFYLYAATNIGSQGSPKTPTVAAADAYELLVDVNTKLNEKNVPRDGRWCIVPPWYEGLLLKDDRFVHNTSLGSAEPLLNGQIGRASGLRILISNNVVLSTTVHKIMAGHSMAITLAEQLAQTRAYEPELRMAQAMKGLHLYGAAAIQPDALVTLHAVAP